MIDKKLTEASNYQLNREMYSAYLYLSMSAYFESLKLGGFAVWMCAQAQEEMGHAMKFYKHLRERDARIILTAIEAPPSEWDSPLAVFEATYEHEQKVTGLIHGLVDQAKAGKDAEMENFLQWFVKEQGEEEESAQKVVDKLKRAGGAPGALAQLDKELGERQP